MKLKPNYKCQLNQPELNVFETWSNCSDISGVYTSLLWDQYRNCYANATNYALATNTHISNHGICNLTVVYETGAGNADST